MPPQAEKKSHRLYEEAAVRIRRSALIALILPDALNIEVVGSAVALAAGLRALGKTVSFFGPKSSSPGALALWEGAGESGEPLREFIISFDLSRSPIRELKYERENNRLNIILAPTGARIRREDVEFRYGALRYDLVIAIGVPRLEAANSALRPAPELPHEKPVINIDRDPANTGYGEVNLLASEVARDTPPTIPEMIDALLRALSIKLDDVRALTGLFAGLRAATYGFHPAHTRPEAFLLAGTLLERGADITLIPPDLHPVRPFSHYQLWGRAMARSRFDDKQKILWSFVTRDDFSATNTTEDALPSIMEELTATFRDAGRHVLLFQESASDRVRALITSREEHDAAALAPHMTLTGPSAYTSRASFADFISAEEHIRQLLMRPNKLQ